MSKTQHNKYPNILYSTESVIAQSRSVEALNRSAIALIRSTEVLNNSVVALIKSTEVLNSSVVVLIRSTEVLNRSVIALIRSTEVLNRDVPAHVVTEVSCHLIPSLRHSYNYMYSETSILLLGHELCSHHSYGTFFT